MPPFGIGNAKMSGSAFVPNGIFPGSYKIGNLSKNPKCHLAQI